MDTSEYVSINQFAKSHGVPRQAVLNAISLNKLKTCDLKIDGEAVIHAGLLVDYKFDLIGIYEYAERKNVTFNAIYKRIDNGKMLYSLEELSDVMKIDWELYKDEKFRSFSFKHRGKKSNSSLSNP